MEQNKLCEAVKLVARSYLFIYVHIMIGGWDLLPNWLGYFWILSAIPLLAEAVRSTALLKPLGIVLVMYTFLHWVMKALGLTAYMNSIYILPLLETVCSVISIYFHFQLLTDLADLAAMYLCASEKTIRRLRTVCTLINTIVALPLSWEGYEMVYMAMLVVDVIAVIWISWKLYAFRRELWSHLEESEAPAPKAE